MKYPLEKQLGLFRAMVQRGMALAVVDERDDELAFSLAELLQAHGIARIVPDLAPDHNISNPVTLTQYRKRIPAHGLDFRDIVRVLGERGELTVRRTPQTQLFLPAGAGGPQFSAHLFGTEEFVEGLNSHIDKEFALSRSFVEQSAEPKEPEADDAGTRADPDITHASRHYTDRELMEMAIEYARKCVNEPGRASPEVGAVIARDGLLLGGAYRGETVPGEHAEYTLLERKLADETLAGTTLYVTLEPCTRRNAPKIPCAERIAERRIARVFIGVLDPNPTILGRGAQFLRRAGIQIALFDSDLMPVIEELNRDFSRQHSSGLGRERTPAETMDPIKPGQLGPNGHRIGYTEDGDKVEWIPDEENPGEESPLLLRRSDKAIRSAYDEFWDKVWWTRHQVWAERVESGNEVLTEANKEIYRKAQDAAKRIEEKYGTEDLLCDTFQWGVVSGRMSALAWVTGAEWDESFDT